MRHRTFRTVFDPYSAEYNGTSMEQKIGYLSKCISNGLSLKELIFGYKAFYLEEKPHVLSSLEGGLMNLTTKLLSENKK